ncbi:MAG: TRAP transporter substrate-binding protein [Oscillospiraceae bacterium]|jgi:tripartite ATP-independent transporter DctP family solute receptor|nr:Putative transporter [Ruminococcaceae bacterium BL-4]
MFKRKSILALALAAGMTFSLAGCGGSSSSSSAAASSTASKAAAATSSSASGAATGTKVGKTVLKCSFNQSADNPEAKTVVEMSDKLYDATDGRYSIEVYPNELLGSQKDSLELVENGAIDMAIVANSMVENVNPDFAVIGCPYMFDSIDHQKKLFQSGALDDLYATTESAGFDVLAAYSLGARCIYTKSAPVKTPADLSGKKIRVMQSDTMVQMLKYMGGVGTPMSQGDVYSAIQAGTLDGAENNIITYVDLKQYEVAPYFSETNHLMIPDELIISSSLFKGMSEDDAKALKKVAKESVDTMFNLSAKLRDEYLTKCKNELGVTITTVDIKPFQDAMQPLIDSVSNRSDMTKSIYQEIQKLK